MDATTDSTDLGSARLQGVLDHFRDEPAVAWMVAAGAVIQTYKVISQRAEAVLGEIGDLTMARYEILGWLDRAGAKGMAVGQLKDATFLRAPTLTYTIDALERRSLVRRGVHPTDRRSTLVVITPAGRGVFAHASAALGKVHFGLLGVDAADAAAVRDVLARAHQP